MSPVASRRSPRSRGRGAAAPEGAFWPMRNFGIFGFGEAGAAEGAGGSVGAGGSGSGSAGAAVALPG